MRSIRDSSRVIRLALLLILAGLLGACGGTSGNGSSSGGKIGGTVTVLASWGGSEQASFLAMVKPFEDQTGVHVQYEGTRDLESVLTARVQGGNPPDLAGLPGPGQMAAFARAGKMVDLNSVLDMTSMRSQYSDSWMQLGQVDGKQVGIFIKVALKGLIWYNPADLSKVHSGSSPRTFDDLLALSNTIAGTNVAPWCIGLESGATSGWPGTDWLSDIVLRQSGPTAYDAWYQGKLKWSSPEIKQAWQTWGEIAGIPKMVYGGKQSMLSTNFGSAGDPMFSSPPRCYLYDQANFISDFFHTDNPTLKPVTNYNFFPFPDIDPQNDGSAVVGGDLFGMFHETPQSRALIAYLTTPAAQAIWVRRGGALSPNRDVAPSSFPDPLVGQEVQILTSAKTVRFGAGDLMPAAMTDAFYKGVLDFVQNPGNLDAILTGLDKAQADAYKP